MSPAEKSDMFAQEMTSKLKTIKMMILMVNDAHYKFG